MKTRIWVEITEAELREKTADELEQMFGPTLDEFYKFCSQEDVTFDLMKDITL